ncbi:AprI/Inh family metalloprotease inhibitor [Pelagibacterium montanilacus]|uniref:AprI/Inh family metalloprotease inhibitor n=1 Tax=Pelagibacterium montanilacus TaxID=2185280 RepID=UPI000F8EDF76|nr:AprI/Inh family metalloprotease inhibitor [Pelagibacterium montanilacus]
MVRVKTTTSIGSLCAALFLAGCASTTTPPATGLPQPAPITPITTGTVESSDLPPIGGGTGDQGAGSTFRSSSALPADTRVSNASSVYDPSGSSDAASTTTSGGFVSLDDISPVGTSSGGRNLSGDLTMEGLLGGWTLRAGTTECRLNLTYTAKGATGHYRASTPGCTQETLAGVAAWQLLGSQIQLYDDADQLIGTLLRSGDRFVGTLAGGQSVTLTG